MFEMRGTQYKMAPSNSFFFYEICHAHVFLTIVKNVQHQHSIIHIILLFHLVFGAIGEIIIISTLDMNCHCKFCGALRAYFYNLHFFYTSKLQLQNECLPTINFGLTPLSHMNVRRSPYFAYLTQLAKICVGTVYYVHFQLNYPFLIILVSKLQIFAYFLSFLHNC